MPTENEMICKIVPVLPGTFQRKVSRQNILLSLKQGMIFFPNKNNSVNNFVKMPNSLRKKPSLQLLSFKQEKHPGLATEFCSTASLVHIIVPNMGEYSFCLNEGWTIIVITSYLLKPTKNANTWENQVPIGWIKMTVITSTKDILSHFYTRHSSLSNGNRFKDRIKWEEFIILRPVKCLLSPIN